MFSSTAMIAWFRPELRRADNPVLLLDLKSSRELALAAFKSLSPKK